MPTMPPTTTPQTTSIPSQPIGRAMAEREKIKANKYVFLSAPPRRIYSEPTKASLSPHFLCPARRTVCQREEHFLFCCCCSHYRVPRVVFHPFLSPNIKQIRDHRRRYRYYDGIFYEFFVSVFSFSVFLLLLLMRLLRCCRFWTFLRICTQRHRFFYLSWRRRTHDHNFAMFPFDVHNCAQWHSCDERIYKFFVHFSIWASSSCDLISLLAMCRQFLWHSRSSVSTHLCDWTNVVDFNRTNFLSLILIQYQRV